MGGELYHVRGKGWRGGGGSQFYALSRSLQDHFAVKISSKSARFEPNSNVTSTNVLSRGERFKGFGITH